MKKILSAMAVALVAASSLAHAGVRQADPYTDGAREVSVYYDGAHLGDKADPYTQGAKAGDKFDPYTEGAKSVSPAAERSRRDSGQA